MHMHTYTLTPPHTCTCVLTHTHAHTRMYTHTCMHTHVHTHIHTCTHTHAHTHVHRKKDVWELENIRVSMVLVYMLITRPISCWYIYMHIIMFKLHAIMHTTPVLCEVIHTHTLGKKSSTKLKKSVSSPRERYYYMCRYSVPTN